jgi:phosphohistidine phosphatase
MASSAARRLVLLRHAKSAWPDVADHERPLARRGRRDAPVAGRWLRTAGRVPDRVVCSTARRARETWQLAAAELDASPTVRLTSGCTGRQLVSSWIWPARLRRGRGHC